MRHIPGIKPVRRDRTGACCGHGPPPGLGGTALAAAAMGRAAAAAAATASELLSEPRASEHEGGSHTGVREGPTARRVLSASRDLASRATRGGYCSGTRDDGEWRLATSRRGRLASKYPWEREAQVTQVTVCRKRPERRHMLARACAYSYWTGVLGGRMDAALTGVDESEVREQKFTTRKPQSGHQ